MRILQGLVAMAVLTAQARAADPVDQDAPRVLMIGDGSLQVTDLTPWLSVMRDPGAQLGISEVIAEDARFEAVKSKVPAFGFTSDAVWLRFTVRSEAEDVRNLLVHLGTARPSHVTWHVVANGQPGRSLANGAADLPRRLERLPMFKLAVPPGEERTVYLRAASDTSVWLPLRIGDAEWIGKFRVQQASADALLLGFCVAIFFLSLLIAWVQRARLFVLFALVVAGYAPHYAIFNGYALQLWPEAPLWVERGGYGLVVGLGLFAFALFNGSFIGRAGMSRPERCLQRLAEGLTLAGMAVFLMCEFRIAVRLMNPLAVSGIMAGLLLACIRRRPLREEVWFTIAWGGLGLMIVIMALQFGNIIPVLVPFRVLQMLAMPSILTAFFLALLIRQRATKDLLVQRTVETQAHELVGNIAAGTYEASLATDHRGMVGPRFRFASRQFLEMFGVERDALLADPAVIVPRIHPQDRRSLEEANAAALACKGAFRWDGRVLVHGATKWFSIVSTPRQTRDGETVWSGLVTDVTTEKEAQNALRRTLEDLPVAVACGTLDDPPRISMTNDLFTKTFGYTAEEIPTVARWVELAYPDEDYRREIMTWWGESLAQAMREKGKVGSREVRLRCKDGSEKEAIVSATVLPGGAVVTFQDVTERNRVARELEAMRLSMEKSAYELTENMPAGTYVLTLTPRPEGGVDLAFRFVSKRFLELFGVGRGALMENPNIVINSIHPEDREHMNESNARAYATNQPFHWEGRTLLDGETRWLSISSNLRVEPDGVTVWEGVVNDITARVEAEQKLAKALETEQRLRSEAEALRREAEKAHEAKSMFLAKMSHEIRTPLSALVSLSQAMWMRGERQESTVDFTRFLNRVRSGGQYLNLLLRNVLNVSAAESGRVPVKASEFYVADWLDEIRNILDAIAEYHRGEIEWSPPEDDEARWRTDQMRLTQIALNLGENALKFSAGRAGPVRIAVECTGSHLRLKVEDRGPGIPRENLAAVFDEFTQAGAEVSPVDDGVGLGLAVVRINAGLLGGAVRAEALKPQGTRFIVDLPQC